MRNEILVIGSANMDLVVQAPRLPKPGETLSGGGFRLAPGGKGANQAVAASRLGVATAFVGRCGCDPFGAELRASLAGSGVDVAAFAQDPAHATGVAVILVQPDGQNSIVIAPGANHALRPSDLEAVAPLFGRAAFVLVQLEIPLDTVEAALDLASRHGCRSVLDPAPAVPLASSLLRKASILSPNESETEILLGGPCPAPEAARRFRDMGVECVVLKLGARGCLVAHDDLLEAVPAFDITPVDTTAAGDAFTAGLAAALVRGDTLQAACRYANGAGALACQTRGAQPSLPSRERLEAFLATARERMNGCGYPSC